MSDASDERRESICASFGCTRPVDERGGICAEHRAASDRAIANLR